VERGLTLVMTTHSDIVAQALANAAELGRLRGRLGHIYPLRRRMGHIYPLARQGRGCENETENRVAEDR